MFSIKCLVILILFLYLCPMKENRELIYLLCRLLGGYMEVTENEVVKLFKWCEISKQFKRIK